MTLETAKALKALEIGYTDWQSLLTVYSRYDSIEKTIPYLEDCQKWVDDSVPADVLAKIEQNILSFGEGYARRIKDNLEMVSKSPTTNPILKEVVELAKSL